MLKSGTFAKSLKNVANVETHNVTVETHNVTLEN